MVYSLLGNNCYSILLNGQPKGFFKSTRGVNQGDHISPTLFILAAEFMSRYLNPLLRDKNFKIFGMPRGIPRLNHLAFPNDMIILCKAELRTMQMISKILNKYEQVSSQG